MQLFLERWLPYFIAASGSLLWWCMGITLPNKEGLLGSSLTIGAILTGFLATAKAILMALDSPVMKRIRNTNYLVDLVSYLGQAIWLSLLFCCVALMGYFINTSSSIYGLLWDTYGFLWIATCLAMIVSFIRVTNIMLKILKHPGTNS